MALYLKRISKLALFLMEEVFFVVVAAAIVSKTKEL
jgi:hypothetical protein